MKNTSLRNEILESAAQRYHTEPDHPWARYPAHTVLRHADNKKWYALFMDVPRKRLGLDGEEYVDILNVRADPVMAGSFWSGGGILPGYHMHKGNWITVLLDGTVPMNIIELLLDVSFELTSRKNTRKTALRSQTGSGVHITWADTG